MVSSESRSRVGPGGGHDLVAVDVGGADQQGPHADAVPRAGGVRLDPAQLDQGAQQHVETGLGVADGLLDGGEGVHAGPPGEELQQFHRAHRGLDLRPAASRQLTSPLTPLVRRGHRVPDSVFTTETVFSISNDLSVVDTSTRQEELAVAAAPVWSVDPRTGKQREQVAVEATAAGGGRGRPRGARRPRRARRPHASAPPCCAPPPSCWTRRARTARRGRRRGDRARPGPAHRRTRPHHATSCGAFADDRRRGRASSASSSTTPTTPPPRPAPTCAATRSRWASSPSTRPPTSRSPSPCPAATPPARSPPAARSSSRPTPTTRRPPSCRAPLLRRAAAAARAARGRRRPWCTASRRASSWSSTRWSPPPASPARCAAAVPSSTRRPPGPCRSPSTANWAPSTPS